MPFDPVDDSSAPRYLLESDEEDQFNPLAGGLAQAFSSGVAVEVVGELTLLKPLIVFSGSIGRTWQARANLGERTGTVNVNSVQVGFIFSPSWTKANMLLSETTTRLPVWAMFEYAHVILDRLQPSQVAILDTYGVHTYISAEPMPMHVSPPRFLTTGTLPSALSDIYPFAPPNLLQSTGAAFLSIMSIPRKTSARCTILLAPSFNFSPPFPVELMPISSSWSSEADEWPARTVQSVFAVIGECPPAWHESLDALSPGDTVVDRKGKEMTATALYL